jgi:class 3 adenylate cyclase
VTFLFTDVEGSTALWERQPHEMDAALLVHDEILRAAAAAHLGTIFATGGDAFCVAFGRADAAVAAAVEAQRALAAADWPHGLSLKVRMGLHTGECHERGGDYFGPAVNRAARVKDAANGSQVVLSSSTRDVVAQELGPTRTLVDLGVHELRDVVDPVRLFLLEDPSFESDPRPPRTGGVRAGNLPAAAGELLGRAAEVDAVIDDLSSTQVVTLAGVGGIGKTRLALEVGRRLSSGRRDGVWFAALDTVDRPDAMVRSLLGMLGVEPRAPSDLASLIEGLRFRDALLILDNCEHLLDTAAEVTQAVVASCPRVQVLATSREPRRRGRADAAGPFAEHPGRRTSDRAVPAAGRRGGGGAGPGSRRRRDRPDLSPARWHPARHRACSGARPIAASCRDRRPPRRHVPAVDRRPPWQRGAPSNAPSDAGVVL